MKKFFPILVLLVLVKTSLYAQYPDLPGNGSPYNVQTLHAGSMIIAMDNKNQGGTASIVVNNLSCSYTTGSAVLTTANTTGIAVGQLVSGQAAIPAGATVVSFVTNTSITISAPVTASGSNKAVDFSDYSGVGFNLRAYGLAIRLLDYNKKLKWVIKPGKAKDGIDFSVNAQLMSTTATSTTTSVIHKLTITSGSSTGTLDNATSVVVGMSVTGNNAIGPNTYVQAIVGTTVTLSGPVSASLSGTNTTFAITTHPSFTQSYGTAAALDFKAGPFVIDQADTAGVAAIVAGFNAEGTAVNVYRTTADVPVDVRYDYYRNGVVWKPNAAILNDGGNAAIHETYMVNADVTAANGFTNWTEETTPDFVTRCFTIATEPHNTSAPIAVIQGIRTFVNNGGNFLAECAAIRTYDSSQYARFQATNGFDNLHENGNPAVEFDLNTDLSFYQINGNFGIGLEGGSLWSWRMPSAFDGNAPKNNFHVFRWGVATSNGITDSFTNASVSKLLTSSNLGGMVFYLGSHSYNGTVDYDINGQRMYLNAVMTPTDPQGSLLTAAVFHCASYPNPITVNVGSSAGPTSAYPLTFTLYYDDGTTPGVLDGGDHQTGNIVTINSAGGTGIITSPAIQNVTKTYLLAIAPASGCLQTKYLQAFCSTLAVDQLSFSAKRANASQVNLRWTTGSEINNKGFYVERQIGSGTDWTSVGFVNSQAVGGNSSSELTYSFIDANNTKGVTQYRLRQVDLDDRSKYSEIRIVMGVDQLAKMIIYPNPTNDGMINVVFDEANITRDIQVQDMTGRTIRVMKGITNNNIKIDNLTPGMYTIRTVAVATGIQTVAKFVVSKR